MIEHGRIRGLSRSQAFTQLNLDLLILSVEISLSYGESLFESEYKMYLHVFTLFF